MGIGAGADMLRPLAIAVIGALCISVLLSLVATPVVYYILRTAQKIPARFSEGGIGLMWSKRGASYRFHCPRS